MQPTSLIIGTTLTDSCLKHDINGLINAYITIKNKNISYECISADPKRECMEVHIQEAGSGRPDWEIQGNKRLDYRIPQILSRLCAIRSESNEKEEITAARLIHSLNLDYREYPDPKEGLFKVSRMSYMRKEIANDTYSDPVKYHVASSFVDGDIKCKLIDHDDDSCQYEMIRTAPKKNSITYYLFNKKTPLFVTIDTMIKRYSLKPTIDKITEREALIKKRADIFENTIVTISRLSKTILIMEKNENLDEIMKQSVLDNEKKALEHIYRNFNEIASINNEIIKFNISPDDKTKQQKFERYQIVVKKSLNNIDKKPNKANSLEEIAKILSDSRSLVI